MKPDDLLSPETTAALTGRTTASLRDLRRRGLLINIGVLALPGGGWTTDPDHPQLERAHGGAGDRWLYRPGDLLVLCLAHEIMGLQLSLKTSLELAGELAPYVLAWAVDSAMFAADRATPFAIAWPAVDDRRGTPIVDSFNLVRLADPSRIPDHAGPKAIFFDLRKLADALPIPTRTYLRERYS